MALYDINHEFMRLQEHFMNDRTKFGKCRACTLFATDVNAIDICSECKTSDKPNSDSNEVKSILDAEPGSKSTLDAEPGSKSSIQSNNRIDLISLLNRRLSNNEIKDKIEKKLEYYKSMPIRHYLDKSNTIPEINARLSLFMILDLENKLKQFNSIA